MIKKYIFYLIRWQLSTPILAIVLIMMEKIDIGPTIATIIANFIGGLLFFWVDKFIFNYKLPYPIWTIKYGKCDWCYDDTRLYRKMKEDKYDASKKTPLYLCEKCSKVKEKI